VALQQAILNVILLSRNRSGLYLEDAWSNYQVGDLIS